MGKKVVNFLYLNLGVILVAINIHFFLAPNQFAAGGLGGLVIVLHHFLPNISMGILMVFLNIVLFGAGFAFLGFQVGVKTIYASFALSFMVWLFERVYPISAPLSDDKLIHCYKKGDAVIIDITDNGVGMDKAEIERLGNPFYSTKEKETGLGLMVSYRIIETMEGKIQVFSRKGEGTKFSIILPAIREDEVIFQNNLT